jgi:hypothetical protein
MCEKCERGLTKVLTETARDLKKKIDKDEKDQQSGIRYIRGKQ